MKRISKGTVALMIACIVVVAIVFAVIGGPSRASSYGNIAFLFFFV